MNPASITKRLMKEFHEMRIDPPPNCSAWPMKLDASVESSSKSAKKKKDTKDAVFGDFEGLDLMEWEATITGVVDTPYEGGTFKLRISFSLDYPFKPPFVRFVTKIYHCNINHKGHICLDLLKNNWTPSLTTSKVLLSISQLLADPNPKDPLVQSIALELIDRREWHDQRAREWTKKYAMVDKKVSVPTRGEDDTQECKKSI